MTTRTQKVRLGVFMLLALLLLLGSIATLAGLKLWNPRDRYTVRFDESVSGLESGSTVKMKGVRVGQVEKITIAANVETVIVSLSLEPGTPVKTDTRAVLTSIGITGLQFVELTGGSAQGALVPPNGKGSVIKPAKSALMALTGKAEAIAQKMEGVLNNVLPLTGEENRVRIRNLLDNTNALLTAYTELAKGDTPKRLQRILANLDRTTAVMEKAMAAVGKMARDNSERVSSMLIAGEGAARSINRAVAGLKPQTTLAELNRTSKALRDRVNDPAISKAVAGLSNAAQQMSGLSNNLAIAVRRRDRQLGSILGHLEETVRNFKAFSRSIKERPSLLLRGETLKERTVP